jgi:hypothetical protein
MRFSLYPLLITLCMLAFVAAPSQGANEENPFKKASVGDWASYQLAIEAGGKKLEIKLKVTMTAKDDKQATTKSTITIDGKETPEPEERVDLTKPYDADLWMKKFGSPEAKDMKIKKGQEDKETMTIGKTKYECKWQTFKATFKVQGEDKESEVEFKFWTSPDAPLSGMVKLEVMSTSGKDTTKMTMILNESGKGK